MANYSDFIKLWMEFYGSEKGKKQAAQQKSDEEWRRIKGDAALVQQKCSELRTALAERTAKRTRMWAGFQLPKPRPPSTASSATDDSASSSGLATAGSSSAEKEAPLSLPMSADESRRPDFNLSSSSSNSQTRRTHSQDQLRADIGDLESELNMFYSKKEKRGLSDSEMQQMNALKTQLATLTKTLKRRKDSQASSQKNRDREKVMKRELAQKQLAQGTPAKRIHLSAGSATLRGQQPWSHGGTPTYALLNLLSVPCLQAIVALVSNDASAEIRRRSEQLNACKNLDDLTKELNDLGFDISRSAVYLRLLPRNSATREGQRHIKTVPVKLVRAANDLRQSHTDSHFAMGTIRFLRDLAVLFGDPCVLFLSQDDKARVPLGLAAANKQTPLLMHLQYRVQLPDHDWVVAERHYAGLKVEGSKVTYSGPTYIAIRSGKHDSSTAASHSHDFEKMVDLEHFRCLSKCSDGALKPILIVNVDGGPDENPRYPKVLRAWARVFVEHNLDAVFVATNAPHQSAFNAVERRMAPLSRAMAGLILPHDTCGSHLDRSGRTVDSALEELNFQKAGEALAEIWGKLVLDSYPVVAEYVSPGATIECAELSNEWVQNHVRQSQYLLQIVRCNNRSCCSQFRTNFCSIIVNRFLPAPVRFKQTEEGKVAAGAESTDGHFGSLTERLALQAIVPSATAFKQVPFDSYCPSVRESLGSRVCRQCGLYHPSMAAKNKHERDCEPQANQMRRRVVGAAAEDDEEAQLPQLPVLSPDEPETPMPIANTLDCLARYESDDEIEY